MEAEPTVFLIDDDPGVLNLLTKVVQSLGLKAAAYGSAGEFLKAYEPSGPGCLVLDVRLPGMSGLELQERLAAAGHTLPIIFITGHADVRMAVEAMVKGAFFLMEKPFGMQELCDKIQEAMRLAEKNWQRRLQREDAIRRLAVVTPAERRVLDLVVAGCANRVIAERLGLSVRTVEVHRARLTKKVGLKAQADLLRLVQAASSE